MIYIKKYYRKFLVVFIPLIFIVIVFYLVKISSDSGEYIQLESPITPIEDSEDTTNDLKKINIKGAVVNPGVYSFTDGERVIDAIDKSGGLLESADTSVINLSKTLTDEMVIIIYTYDEVKDMKNQNILVQYVEKECNCPSLKNDACLIDNDTNNGSLENNNGANKISINNASFEDLQTLSGIGEAKARSIIQYREENGAFSSIEDIKNVPGIGNSVFEKIKDYITI